jgi:DNA invertase Pin-like site-specific DNA recombinase
VVWKLDRLGRSMSHLIEKVGELAARGIGFRSLTENIDTTTSGGMLVFNIFGSLAQFERDLIRERTHAGLKAARERGNKGGRRPVVTPDKLRKARAHIAAGLTVREAAARSRSAKPPYTRLWKTRETAGDQELVGAGHRGFDRFGQSVRPPLGIVPGQAPDCWTKARQLAGATDRN